MTEYVLGSDPDEIARLDGQAASIAGASQGLLRMAGIGPGMRVLDLGTGLGHVARSDQIMFPELGVQSGPAEYHAGDLAGLRLIGTAREKASAWGLPLVIGDPDDAVFGAFRVRGAPGTLLLDPEGRVAKPVQMGANPARDALASAAGAAPVVTVMVGAA